MTREIDNSTIQSIRDRLKNRAREENEDFNLVVIRYALERLMYRLSKSDYADQFVLKGARLFLHWQGSLPRPTRDADFAGYEEIEVDDFVGIIKELCEMEIDEEDGMIYLPDTVQGQRIREGATYEGIRVQLKGKLGNQKPTIQFDLGFGDSLVPAPEEIEYPTMLDFPAPKLKAYQQETTIAE